MAVAGLVAATLHDTPGVLFAIQPPGSLAGISSAARTAFMSAFFDKSSISRFPKKENPAQVVGNVQKCLNGRFGPLSWPEADAGPASGVAEGGAGRSPRVPAPQPPPPPVRGGAAGDDPACRQAVASKYIFFSPFLLT